MNTTGVRPEAFARSISARSVGVIVSAGASGTDMELPGGGPQSGLGGT